MYIKNINYKCSKYSYIAAAINKSHYKNELSCLPVAVIGDVDILTEKSYMAVPPSKFRVTNICSESSLPLYVAWLNSTVSSTHRELINVELWQFLSH